jgi:hypothetical protein
MENFDMTNYEIGYNELSYEVYYECVLGIVQKENIYNGC